MNCSVPLRGRESKIADSLAHGTRGPGSLVNRRAEAVSDGVHKGAGRTPAPSYTVTTHRDHEEALSGQSYLQVEPGLDLDRHPSSPLTIKIWCVDHSPWQLSQTVFTLPLDRSPLVLARPQFPQNSQMMTASASASRMAAAIVLGVSPPGVSTWTRKPPSFSLRSINR